MSNKSLAFILLASIGLALAGWQGIPRQERRLCIGNTYTITQVYAIPPQSNRASLQVGIPPGGVLVAITGSYAKRATGPAYEHMVWEPPPPVISYTLEIRPARAYTAETWTGLVSSCGAISQGRLDVYQWQARHCCWLPIWNGPAGARPTY